MRVIRTTLTAAVVTALSTLAAFADDDPCANLNMAEMIGCIGDKITVADAELNETYATLLKTVADYHADTPALASEAEELLRAGQRAWITTRDNDCRVSSMAYEGGSNAGLAHSFCILASTEDRTDALEYILGDYETY